MTSSHLGNSLPETQSWYTYSPQQTLEILEVDPQKGLVEAEIKKRQAYYGANQIIETKGRKNWEIFWDQFRNIMLLMLIAVAIISGILDLVQIHQDGFDSMGIPFKDTIAILVIVIINGVLGYLQESRAEKALAALKNLAAPKVQVIRNGQRIEINSPSLVPGDIVILEAGTQICADGLILEASNFQIREAALTGEAHPVHKYPLVEGLSFNTPLGDRLNLVFTGTEVLQGRAKVVITSTGMNTELGKIATMLQNVQQDPTPLQQRMNQLGNVLVSGSLALVVIVVVLGLIQAGSFQPLKNLVEISLSMAVAVVPEGLPAVITVTLAIGTQRMVKRNALIRKLPAVETLGSVNTICSDKTGTLTQNKMVVQEVQTAGELWNVTGNGYQPQGHFLDSNQEVINCQDYPELDYLLLAAVLCNNAVLNWSGGEWDILGDPTEGALLSLAAKAGIDLQSIVQRYQRLAEIPFSSERKRMSVICQDYSSQTYLFTKGSPELILDLSKFVQVAEGIIELRDWQRAEIREQNNQMASRGLRVLGIAYKLNPQEEATVENDLIWLGLVGMLDAPRLEAKIAVSRCRQAGIRPVMITGDHQLTATAIAIRLGIAQPGDKVLTGQELEELSQPQLEKLVDQVSVYARVSPEHKLRIVKALQKQGKFVAMTGDGVNDAPALKQADIGIAMGITGTDVSKEASDMILLDDNFATIVAATEEGRVVYSNIRRFIKYILGSNIGEVLTIGAAPLLGMPQVPLTPLQILWMNLVTDGIPALALAVEPAEPDVMSRPPFAPKESIFARGLGAYIVRIGIIFAFITITLMTYSFNANREFGNPNSWKTMVFTTLCIAQMGHALAVRSHTRLTVELNPFSNPYLLGAVFLTTVLQLLLIYVPPLRDFFETEILTWQELLICLVFSSLMFIWVELEKLFIRWYSAFKINVFRKN